MTEPVVVLALFALTYGLIVTERIDRTVAALLGGMAMIGTGILAQEQAFAAVDWNVIFLLTGMMLIANIIGDTGLFQWIALQAVRAARGDPFRVLVLLSSITAVASAILDNVTVVVLIVPVTLFVASSIGVNPVPLLVAEILASNIGGTATMIGDPPNVLIGSASGVDFLSFAGHMAPISLAVFAGVMAIMLVVFRRDLQAQAASCPDLAQVHAATLITDGRLLRQSLVILAAVILGLTLHPMLRLEPATVAMTGAVVLTAWSRREPHHVLRDVEWATLLFFVGLFITVEALVQVGLIEALAERTVALTAGSLPVTALLLLWFSGLVSGLIDNVPYTAAAIPVVERLGQSMPVGPLWWSLALGACLGGNATLVGASANIIVASLAARAGHPIPFPRFLRYGVATTLLSLLMASVYVWLRYLRT